MDILKMMTGQRGAKKQHMLTYCISKKSSILYINLPYKMGQDFLYIERIHQMSIFSYLMSTNVIVEDFSVFFFFLFFLCQTYIYEEKIRIWS